MPDGARHASRRHVIRALAGAAASALLPSAVLAAQDAEPPVFSTARHQFTELDPARIMPALRLSRLDGRAALVRPSPTRVTLLNVWASWCPACRTDLRMLDQFQGIAADRVQVIALAIDREGRSLVAPFARSLGIQNLSLYLDPDGVAARRVQAGEDAQAALYGMPITFLIAPSGRIEGYILGSVDWTVEPARQLLDYYASA